MGAAAVNLVGGNSWVGGGAEVSLYSPHMHLYHISPLCSFILLNLLMI